MYRLKVCTRNKLTSNAIRCVKYMYQWISGEYVICRRSSILNHRTHHTSAKCRWTVAWNYSVEFAWKNMQLLWHLFYNSKYIRQIKFLNIRSEITTGYSESVSTYVNSRDLLSILGS